MCCPQVKSLITQLQEQSRQMTDAIQACDAGLEAGDISTVPDTVLRLKPEFQGAEYNKPLVNGTSNQVYIFFLLFVNYYNFDYNIVIPTS